MPQALIWGASGGMGRALVTQFSSMGYTVYGAARDASHIPTTAALAVNFEADYEHGFESATMRVAQETTELDVMVYAVGDIAYDRLDSMGLHGWDRTMRSNVTGAFLAATHTMTIMKEGGHFVFVGAYLEHLRIPRMGAYVAAKAALAELVIVLQKENRKYKYTLVRPGATVTGFWDKVSLKLPADAKTAEQVAHAIAERVESGESGDLDL